jgi:hypothetical protein
MQEHHSTVASAEVRDGIGRVISLAKFKEAMTATNERVRVDRVRKPQN